MTSAERFWSKADKTPKCGCWVWRGPLDYGAYGRSGGVPAHRRAFALANGPIPLGAHIRHTCDAPYCVNPAHLVAGTRADNMSDKRAKGRGINRLNRRERVICLADIDAIRQRRLDGECSLAIATEYGLRIDAVNNIAAGRGLRWLDRMGMVRRPHYRRTLPIQNTRRPA